MLKISKSWVELSLLRLMQVVLTVKRNRIIAGHLPRSAKQIADFGCGHYPNRHANELVDSLRQDDIQRGGLPVAVGRGSRAFHDLDLNHYPYPFDDGYFDYLICSHVLEHLDDPVRACEEFSRVAKAGYIEVPFASVDVFIRNNDPIHTWLCSQEKGTGTLLFTRRDEFLRTFPPRDLNQFLRFYLQFRNLSITWNGELRAAYRGLEAVKRL